MYSGVTMKKYIITFIVLIIVGLLGNSIYNQITQDKLPGKAKRLDCHKKTTVFERGYGIKDIKEAQELLYSGNYKITSGIDKAIHMKSSLFNFVNIEKLDKNFAFFLLQKVKTQKKETGILQVDYIVYENDKEDPNKKSEKSKLFRGYVVMKFKNQNNKVVYQVQIDFMNNEGKDIPKALECAMESFLTYKEDIR
jgi:hypothetical protein